MYCLRLSSGASIFSHNPLSVSFFSSRLVLGIEDMLAVADLAERHRLRSPAMYSNIPY